MNTITQLLSFISAFQLETGTAPTHADIAQRFDWNDLTWWLRHITKMELVIEYMLTYAISAKGLTSLERATGVVKLVSGSMVIGFDPADGDELRREFMAQVISHRHGNDNNGGEFMASTIGNDPRLMGVSPTYHKAIYFGQWFPAETAEAFRPSLNPDKIKAAQESNEHARRRMNE